MYETTQSLEALLKTYLAIGAGGLCVIVLIFSYLYDKLKTEPRLRELEKKSEVNTSLTAEALKNNTSAVDNLHNSLLVINNTFSVFKEVLQNYTNKTDKLIDNVYEVKTDMEYVKEDIKEIKQKINN